MAEAPRPQAKGLEERFAAALSWLEAARGRGLGPSPKLAVGLSGGGDSLALTCLLSDWLRARGGRLLALTVDHCLREGSREEAEAAGKAAEALGAEHRILTWESAAAGPALQARARAARLDLLEAACREAGVKELFLGHTLEDQAETFLLRLEASSDLPGLSGMAALRRRGAVVLWRPLLGEGRQELRRFLMERGLTWSDDPSNEDPSFSRVRLRRLLPSLAEEGVTPALLSATARDLGLLRARLEPYIEQRLLRAASLEPEGLLRIRSEEFLQGPEPLALWCLARAVTAIGGAPYQPRRDSLERLQVAVQAPDFPGATLGGCRILPRQGELLVFREAAGLPEPRILEGKERLLWDGRFDLTFSGAAKGFRLAPLGPEGWAALKQAEPALAAKVRARLPVEACHPLPALFDGQGLAGVPALGYRRADLTQPLCLSSEFAPLNPLKHERFTVAPPERHIIY